LHAQKLERAHPLHGGRVEWEVALPEDMHSLLSVLRQRGTVPQIPFHA